MKQVIKDLKSNKSVDRNIPTIILKERNFAFSVLADCINTKRDDPLDKENYRPVSILPSLSKIFEKLIYKQLSNHIESFLSAIPCCFREAQNTQHALFKLLHFWQKELDQKGFVDTILMDLLKAYGCIPQNLPIAKLEWY